MSFSSDWTDAEKEKLRALWAERPQLSSAQIAERMGRSQNSVLGAAHRMALPPRQSPIRWGGAAKPERAVRPRVTLPPVVAPAAAVPAAPAPAQVIPQRRVSALARCRMPLWGDREKPDHRYCDKPALTRRDGTPTSWCAACARRVWDLKALAA